MAKTKKEDGLTVRYGAKEIMARFDALEDKLAQRDAALIECINKVDKRATKAIITSGLCVTLLGIILGVIAVLA